MIESFSSLYFITLAMNAIYVIVVTVVILTYRMHQYLDERSVFYTSVDIKEGVELT